MDESDRWQGPDPGDMRKTTVFQPPPGSLFRDSITSQDRGNVKKRYDPPTDDDIRSPMSRSNDYSQLRRSSSPKASVCRTCHLAFNVCFSQAGKYRGCCCLSLSAFVMCLAICGILDGLVMITFAVIQYKKSTETVASKIRDFVRSTNVLIDEGPGSLIYHAAGNIGGASSLEPNHIYLVVTGSLVVLISALVAVGVLRKLAKLLGSIVFLLAVAFVARLGHDIYMWVAQGEFGLMTVLVAIVAYTLRGIQIDAIYSLFCVMRQGGTGFEYKSAIDIALAEEKEPLQESMIDSGMVRI